MLCEDSRELPVHEPCINHELPVLQLQTQELGLFLRPSEVEAILQAHPTEPGGELVNYATFATMARNYIIQLYEGRQQHPGTERESYFSSSRVSTPWGTHAGCP